MKNNDIKKGKNGKGGVKKKQRVGKREIKEKDEERIDKWSKKKESNEGKAEY